MISSGSAHSAQRVVVGWAVATAVTVMLAIGIVASAPLDRSPSRGCASQAGEIPERYQDFTDVQGTRTWFPFGVACEWTSSAGTFRAGPGWTVTLALIAPLVAGGGMLLHTAVASSHRRTLEDEAATSPSHH